MAVLLFDYDGVIADSLQAEKEFFLPICHKRKIKAISTEEDLRKLCDGNVFECLEHIGVSFSVYMEAFNEFHEVLTNSEYRVKPYDGMIELLSKAASKLPVYIVTSNFYHFPSEMLSRYGVTGVKAILSGEKEPSKVKKIDSIKEMYPDDRIYFITDTTGDILEAKESSADEIIAVSWGWHDRKRLEAAAPDRIFNNVGELTTYIKQMF